MAIGAQQHLTERLRVCVVGLGGGGFHWEAQRIIQAVQRPLELVLVYGGPDGGIVHWDSDDHIASSYIVRSPSLTGDSRWGQLLRTSLNLWHAVRILAKEGPDIVLAVGTAQALPFALAARLLNQPVWYVESVTRVRTPSRTGRWIARLRVAARLYYYSPDLRAYYPSGTCIEHSEHTQNY
jgi:UDP-N-acetylglucosamine:LPS N-acetylglucosamine transferase